MSKLFFLITLLVYGCSYSREKLPPAGSMIEVNYHQVICQGEAAQWCMQVRNKGAKEWEYFYDSIAGFRYQWGYNYLLKVEKKTIRNPAQDASSVRWVLKSIVSQKKVPVNTVFNISLNDVKPTIDSVTGKLQIIDKFFSIDNKLSLKKLDSVNYIRFRFNVKNEPEVLMGY